MAGVGNSSVGDIHGGICMTTSISLALSGSGNVQAQAIVECSSGSHVGNDIE